MNLPGNKRAWRESFLPVRLSALGKAANAAWGRVAASLLPRGWWRCFSCEIKDLGLVKVRLCPARTQGRSWSKTEPYDCAVAMEIISHSWEAAKSVCEIRRDYSHTWAVDTCARMSSFQGGCGQCDCTDEIPWAERRDSWSKLTGKSIRRELKFGDIRDDLTVVW